MDCEAKSLTTRSFVKRGSTRSSSLQSTFNTRFEENEEEDHREPTENVWYKLSCWRNEGIQCASFLAIKFDECLILKEHLMNKLDWTSKKSSSISYKMNLFKYNKLVCHCIHLRIETKILAGEKWWETLHVVAYNVHERNTMLLVVLDNNSIAFNGLLDQE